MRVAFGSDEETDLTAFMRAQLEAAGHVVEWVAAGEAWPEVGKAVGEAVSSGVSERGVVCCHTGTGVSIAANKVDRVRAALCNDPETAVGARRWNDANVLALGLRSLDTETAAAMLEAFLTTGADPEESALIARVR